ncbi:MAG: Hpt domain-containing protein [Gammaproteobacteria bacterium]|nr:Hpt domain-containing protein [Gammaproteobacteria bacterium]MBU2545803.1 Hpt domain-containing protein [Gammaproteobacteria bacterium]
MEENFKQLQVIDLDLGARIVGGDRELAEEMIRLLVQTLPELQTALTNAYQQHNATQLLKAAHKLHGAASYSGTPRLKLAAKQLELIAKENNEEKLQQAYQTLLTEIEAVQKTAMKS